MTAFVFIFKSAGEGEGWFEGDSTWLIHYKKQKKSTDSHPTVLLNSFKFCAPVVFVWSWLFFSCLRRRGQRYKRGSDITIFFPNIAFYFYYHKMNLLYSFIISYKPLKLNRKRLSHKLCYISGIFDNILRWKFFLERDIAMIFCGHRHIIITHCLTLA
jgi:hypothetical protein